MLNFPEFSTQPGKDVVRVFQCTDSTCTTQQQLAEISGTYAARHAFTTNTGIMRLVFTSDSSVNYEGFTASWSSVCICRLCSSLIVVCCLLILNIVYQLLCNDSFSWCVQWQISYPCTGCGSACGLRNTASGTLSDGSGLSTYASNSRCEWIIAPPGALQVTIDFSDFKTQTRNDFVHVWQCTTPACLGSTLLAELFGLHFIPQTITSTTGFMKVVFTSDSSVNYDGFNASWTSVRVYYCVCTQYFCLCF